MSNRTQEEGRFEFTEKDYPFAPPPLDVARVNNRWEIGLLWATRVCDPSFDRICNLVPIEINAPLLELYTSSASIINNIQVLDDFNTTNNWTVAGRITNYQPSATYLPVEITRNGVTHLVNIQQDGTFSYTASNPLSDFIADNFSITAKTGVFNLDGEMLVSNVAYGDLSFIIKANPRLTVFGNPPNNFLDYTSYGVVLLSLITSPDPRTIVTDARCFLNDVIANCTLTNFLDGSGRKYVNGQVYLTSSQPLKLGENTYRFEVDAWNPNHGGEDTRTTTNVEFKQIGFSLSATHTFVKTTPALPSISKADTIDIDVRITGTTAGVLSPNEIPVTAQDVKSVKLFYGNDYVEVPGTVIINNPASDIFTFRCAASAFGTAGNKQLHMNVYYYPHGTTAISKLIFNQSFGNITILE